ncbi:23S rRNA pseudouridine(1911/1915/1917) synthase RluD [Candidatus Blochmannia ocreatus (nom. nud.)]|uniref:Pseudouridine synthase n=1 Tax=Candidatus Blochmannia ocreatus (nom. nud.) TaxID=251538 RepID=A0ABY4SWT9_9ENTR|nr:23S rRNA pseudouridine(1911/1915/1917) synthase RluD [Candidatus Blochmannia ocreatus]URJ25261.1 23S rRNA pseudouridine(1911/1915/1917) synthase RluD [Candidatus Blochmannia ocreatus]
MSHSGERLDYALAKILPNYSRSKIKSWILSHKVSINKIISTIPKKKITGGEFVEIKNVIETDNSIIPQNIPLDIVYEDHDILIINKAKNIVVHPGVKNNSGTILNALLYKYPDIVQVHRAGIVQRLDKDTTGLMIVAKNTVSYHNLLQLFKKKQIIREYVAIVLGKFPNNAGQINQPICRHTHHRTKMMANPVGKSAITKYWVIETFKMHTKLNVRIETGRTHQIRVHMSYIKHPIIGDRTYGKCTYSAKNISNELNKYLMLFSRQALHACRLQILHPISNIKMQWKIPLPQDIIDLIKILRQ